MFSFVVIRLLFLKNFYYNIFIIQEGINSDNSFFFFSPFSFSLFLPMLALDHDLPTSSVAGITAVHHYSHFLTPFLKNRHFFGEGSIGV
jgi:hypothetical protein